MAIFPSPGPARPGVRIFLAPRLWEFNVCGAVVAGIGGAVVLSVVAGILIWLSHRVEWLAVALILNIVAGLLVLFPGNFVAAFPYSVGMEEGKGVWFYAPFKKMYVPLDEIKGIQWSYLHTGWVVKLRKRRGLLKTITVHAAFGSQGREFALAIQKQIGKIG